MAILKIRSIEHASIIGARSLTLAAKFALTAFVARFLGFSDLGLYGLLVAVSTMAPIILGLGLNGVIQRDLVDMPLSGVLPHITTRFVFNIAIYLVLIPAFLIGCSLRVFQINLVDGVLMSAIVFSEHIFNDLHAILIGRRRAAFANVLLFVRSAAWVPFYVASNLLFPQSRTFTSLLVFWTAGMVVAGVVFLPNMLRDARWREMRIDPDWLIEGIRRSRVLYVYDLATSLTQYMDRFIISSFLGLEATGIYVFFWSVASAINNLVYASITQTYVPVLVGWRKQHNEAAFAAAAKRMLLESGATSIVLSVCLWVIFPIVVPYLQRPVLLSWSWGFGVVLIATQLRLLSDAVTAIVYSRYMDARITLWAWLSLALTGVCDLVGVTSAGLTGVIWGYLAATIGMCALRLVRSPLRQQL